MASDAELASLWDKHRHELHALLSSWSKQQETLLQALTATASRSTADMMPGSSSASKAKARGTATSKPEPPNGNTQSYGDPPSKANSFNCGKWEAELLDSRNLEALSCRSAEAAADHSDASCGGSTEDKQLDNIILEENILLEELRASVPEGGASARKEACHAAEGAEEEVWPADTDDADSGVRSPQSSATSWQNPGLQHITDDAPMSDVSAILKDAPQDVGKLEAVVASRFFEVMCSFVILCNAVSIAIGTNRDFRKIDDYRENTISRFFFLLERSFFLFYVVEIALRMYVFRKSFFCGKDARWNCFDTFLVAHAAFDQAAQWVSSAGAGVANLSFFRIMRLLKMFKLLRVFRLMRSFKGLRLVLNGILGSMHAMSYAMILTIATTFMFGTAIVQSCTIYVDFEQSDEQTLEDIRELWSSVPRSMLSLFMASTSGDSWRVLARPLEKVGVLAYTIFIIYLAFFVFVIANTLTSLFVENSIAFAAADEQLVVQQELEKKDEYIQKVKRFFDLVDTDGSGEITYREFLDNLSSPILHAFASSLEIDIHDAREFFHVLSVGGTQKVDVQTFVVGCIKLRGHAKSMDLMDLIYSWKKSSQELVWQQTVLLQRVDSVDKTLCAMCDLIVHAEAHPCVRQHRVMVGDL